MKKIILSLATVLAVASLILSGCSKDFSTENQIEEELTEIVGARDYINSLADNLPIITKAGEISEEEAAEFITPMFPSAISFLQENGYDYHEDFDEGDPLIIYTALALAETYFKLNQPQTKGWTDEAEVVINCVIWGGDGGGLAGLGTKAIVKKIATKLAEKAVGTIAGGVGVAVGVATAGLCLYNHYK